jgi:transcriptional regulator with XRE-family HTH domain
MISVRQIKAAQALLGWTQVTLAAKARLSSATVAAFESVDGEVSASAHGIVEALQAAGVEFLAEDGEGFGVKLKKAKPSPVDAADLNASNDE